MTFETKFNPKDEVWTMSHNKPTKMRVLEVHCGAYTGGKHYNSYKCVEYGYADTGNNPKYFEYELFKTKEELIESL